MTTKKLNDVLEKHKKWVNREEGGERAYLRGTNLRGVYLTDADLTDAVLTGANLRGAHLTDTDLTRVILRDTDLRNTSLVGADLKGADIRGAVLTGTNLDYSCWPLWCGSFDVKVDKRIAAQLAYHFCRLDCDDPEYQEARKALTKLANQFHRVDECGRIEDHV